MPLSRISLIRGKSAAYLAAIQDSLHRALVETFEVPPTDRFQILEQVEPHELSFDRHYQGGPRSDDFVLFTITTGRTRSAAIRQAFFSRLVETLGDNPGVRPQDVMIVVTNSSADDWSFSDGVSMATVLAR